MLWNSTKKGSKTSRYFCWDLFGISGETCKRDYSFSSCIQLTTRLIFTGHVFNPERWRGYVAAQNTVICGAVLYTINIYECPSTRVLYYLCSRLFSRQYCFSYYKFIVFLISHVYYSNRRINRLIYVRLNEALEINLLGLFPSNL